MSTLANDPVARQIYLENKITDDLYYQVLDSFVIFSEYVWHEIGIPEEISHAIPRET